jgi:hypothetical protein
MKQASHNSALFRLYTTSSLESACAHHYSRYGRTPTGLEPKGRKRRRFYLVLKSYFAVSGNHNPSIANPTGI